MTLSNQVDQTFYARAHHDGFFLVEGLVPPAECEGFAGRLQEYAAKTRTVPEGVSLHREPALERSGRSEGGATGDDIRKVSGLFHDDLFRQLISREDVLAHIRALVGSPPRLFRADALMKPAAVGSAKGVHQDSPYWPIEPMSLWSCWIPFDDATLDNGCLVVVPGSHRDGPAPHASTEDDYVIPAEHYSPDQLVPVPMKQGTAIFFHSLLVHGSAANTSGTPRRAVTMSYLGPDHGYTGDAAEPAYPVVG